MRRARARAGRARGAARARHRRGHLRRPRRAARERAQRLVPGEEEARAFVEDLKTLAVGDFVVHVEHGVGKYLGLVHKDVGTTRVDLISIEYAGGDRLYLPVYRLNQIEKLSGSESAPKLDRLGGSTFLKTKDRAKREVRQMADELLKLYAERRALVRDPLPPPDDDLRAFEATFPFDETPDQATAIVDVEGDLSGPHPMDRLVCGDVGFGKTEVAIRAAFRVASAGRQVAVLCPTTVLAQQHFLAFQQRFSGYPINVRSLSRFTTANAARDTLAGMKSGGVDVVIGTHRLLSKDVHWKRLGLVVIDEEQRFGVAHKERMKHLRTSVDVLTLSATPIPRTLQMAVSSLRDMSIITTPPVDRRASRTVVAKHDETVIKAAIVREIDRGGQVFYVYNRVEGLYERAARLAELVPTARIAVGHGQLSDAALEQTMIDFVEGRYDVLCATAIIESGLDIPRANTMIIDRADMFGLSQLYQLRGRVGRSRERAVCYLLVPPQNAMTDESRSRIEALERHTDLGSGFHVASLDLEIRGAGDLLGADQSGVVSSIGFDLFTRMLDEAVAELSGETVAREVDTDISIDEEALLPDDYIDDVGARLSLYKRFAGADSSEEVNDVAVEMEDRFGPAPEAARRLVRMMVMKVELRRLRVLGCDASKQRVNLHMSEDAPVDTPKLLALVQAKRSPFKLSPDMRITRRFADGEVKSALDAIDLTLRDLASCFRATV
ncbi:MAG: transcription-repair coupling factor [Polyangiaceae bacterium]